MRAIWSGSISFELVNIPVKLYSAAEDRAGIDLHMLHSVDQAPIRYVRVCSQDGQEVPFADIVKGYEYAKGQFVVLTDEDFVAADPKKTSAIEVMEFADEAEIDPSLLERPFYLEPAAGAEKAYGLLREALKRSGLVAVCRFVLRERQHLAAITVSGRALVLNQMRFPSDIKSQAGLKLPPPGSADAGELKLATALIGQLTHRFAPEDFHDDYTAKLERRIEAKLKHLPAPKAAAVAAAEPIGDLLAALKASLEQTEPQSQPQSQPQPQPKDPRR